MNEHEKPMGNYAAGLFHNPSGADGLTVYTFTELSVEGKIVTIVKQAPIHYDANLGWADYYDANFPVDINLYVSETEPANGDLYYGDNDFIGKYGESALVSIVGNGSGLMVGRLRGWGYCEFSYQLEGVGLNMSFSAGIIEGKFQGKRGDQIPDDLAGDGSEDAYGAYFMSGTTWKSFQIRKDGTKDLKFKGSSEGISIGLPGVNGSFGTFETLTSLLYPKRIE